MAKKGLFETVGACRHFFQGEGFLETPTPPMVSNPGMETHLHPFQIKSVYQEKDLSLYLHTSPEFYMKELLSEGFEKIYQLGWCFRDEPNSSTHRPQFLMLEWYRANSHYHDILEDSLKLIKHSRNYLKEKGFSVKSELKVTRTTVSELFWKYLNFEILNFLNVQDLEEKILKDYPELLGEKPQVTWQWEDYFFLLFLNRIEIHFKNYDLLVVDEFPAPLAALSTLKDEDPSVCQRFEIYLFGVELANCFNELTQLEEQKLRMKAEAMKKSKLYGYELPEPTVLFKALQKGIPKSAGIALGVERLYLGLSKDLENPFYD